MAKGRAEDGRVVLPRPPAGDRKPANEPSIQDQARRAVEIQIAGSRRLESSPAYRGLVIAANLALVAVVLPLLDAWLFSKGMLDWSGALAFTAAFVFVPPAVTVAGLVAWWVRRPR